MPVYQTVATLNRADGVDLPAGMEKAEATQRTLYTIDELSGAAKEKALMRFYGTNIDYEWWEHIYEDAKTIGLVITEFDLDSSKKIRGSLTESLVECCRRIMREHGKECETRQTAREYLKEYASKFRAWRAKEAKCAPECCDYSAADWFNEFESEGDAEELTEEFERDLLQDYFSMLRNEYDYQTSEEQVLEAVRANEYLFTEDGELAR